MGPLRDGLGSKRADEAAKAKARHRRKKARHTRKAPAEPEATGVEGLVKAAVEKVKKIISDTPAQADRT